MHPIETLRRNVWHSYVHCGFVYKKWSEHEEGKASEFMQCSMCFSRDTLFFTFLIHGLNTDMVYSLNSTVSLPTAKRNLDANSTPHIVCVFWQARHGLLMDLTLADCLWRFKGTWNCHEVDFHYDSSFYSPPENLQLSRLLSFDWILFDSLVLGQSVKISPVQGVYTGNSSSTLSTLWVSPPWSILNILFKVFQRNKLFCLIWIKHLKRTRPNQVCESWSN